MKGLGPRTWGPEAFQTGLERPHSPEPSPLGTSVLLSTLSPTVTCPGVRREGPRVKPGHLHRQVWSCPQPTKHRPGSLEAEAERVARWG